MAIALSEFHLVTKVFFSKIKKWAISILSGEI